MHRETYRGIEIVAHEREGGWQARAEGIVALSAVHRTCDAAVDEIKRFIDASRTAH